MTEKSSSYRILIIGGGISGLSTAYSLLHSCPPHVNLKVQILEASHRLGGRICSVPIPGAEHLKVNLGASFVHGHKDNPVYEHLLEEGVSFGNNMKSSEWDEPIGECIFDSEGNFVPYPTQFKFESLYERLKNQVYKTLPTPPKTLPQKEEEEWKQRDVSLQSLFDPKLKETLEQQIAQEKKKNGPGETSKWLKELEKEQNDPQLFEIAKWGITCYNGIEASNLSSLFLHSETDSHGSNLTVGDYEQLIRRLQRLVVQHPQGCEILLNSPVVSVHFQKNSSHNIKVTTSESREFEADFVVVTASVACLRDKTIQFEPSLSESKEKAIQSIGLGHYELIEFGFERPFWVKKHGNMNWIHMIRAEETTGATIGFLNYYKVFRWPVLTGHFFGQSAVAMAKLSDQQIIDWMNNLMKKCYPSNWQPVKWVRLARWTQNPFIRTGFSTLSVGSSPYDLERLAEPERSFDNRLLFAGEATYRYDWGTVRAAYLSGQREAQRILKELETKGLHPQT